MAGSQCSKCGNPLDRNGRYCKACHAAYMRAWRPDHPLRGDALKRQRARNLAGNYLRRGKIERRACEICGAPAEMHHDDYARPLMVRWLCRTHHEEMHREGKHE